MSTFNQPSNLGPPRIERREEAPQEPGEVRERPSPEKVTPSQQGKFLSELEKKDKKKETKRVSSDSSEEEETVEGTEKGLFGLAQKVKGRKSLSEESSGEEGAEEGEEQPKQAPVVPQAVAPVLPVLEKPIEKGEEVSRISPDEALLGAREDKERVAFRTPSGKEGERAAQPLPIAPRPELISKAKESTLEETKAAREALFELFKQAVDALTTMVSKTQTISVVTIKYPPIFEGASLVVTEYSLAKKEYNITFGNLSPDARRLLETMGSEQQLRQTLIDKGYTLHMMTIESRPFKVTPAGIETTSPENRQKERTFEQGAKEQKERE